MNSNASKGPLGLRIIGGFKVVCALLLVALAVGVFKHVNSDPAIEAEHLIAALKLDPDNRYIHSVLTKVSGVSTKQLRLVGIGTLMYALLYAVEGVGLLLRKHWAEYFTVIATGSLIPLEIWEVYRKVSMVKVGILAINVAIVVYLIVQLLRPREKGSPTGAGD